MSEPTADPPPADPPPPEPTMPETWPQPFDEWLRTVPSGRNRSEKFTRTLGCIMANLRERHPGATSSDARKLFVNLQREGLADPEEWEAISVQFTAWWQAERRRLARRNRNGGVEGP